MTAYYNENDPFAANWLRELIKAGLIAPGDVDERSIEDVTPNDVAPYTQRHFFAGIGGWSYALRRAGWPDDRPVWTGSCPCQPFSAAGKGAGFADERHLWPAWFWLIRQCRPTVIFGEQVSSKDGLNWLGLISSDLEAAGYAVGAADLCAAGAGVAYGETEAHQNLMEWLNYGAVQYCIPADLISELLDFATVSSRELIIGASHARQRLWFVADTGCIGWQRRQGAAQGRKHDGQDARRLKGDNGLVGLSQTSPGPVGNTQLPTAARQRKYGREMVPQQKTEGLGLSGAIGWAAADWLPCRDGKARPVEPGTFPLAHGLPARVGRLRGYGNAIVPQVAALFIEAYLEAERG